MNKGIENKGVQEMHWWVSTCDGSPELSHDPFVLMVYIISLFYDSVTTSSLTVPFIFILKLLYNVMVNITETPLYKSNPRFAPNI